VTVRSAVPARDGRTGPGLPRPAARAPARQPWPLPGTAQAARGVASGLAPVRRALRGGPAGRPRPRVPLVTALALACVLAAGCASTSPGPAGSGHTARAEVTARSLPRVGTVLVNGQGRALYMFVPDNRQKVTCTGVCAATWPPMKLPPGTRPAAGPGVKAALLGSDPDPGGGRVVTYNGWPLYTYTADVQPGQATGQAINLNGGYWYLLRPSGKPLTTGPR